MQNDNPLLIVNDVYKAFDREDVVKGVSLELMKGEIGGKVTNKVSLIRIIKNSMTLFTLRGS